MAPIHERGSMDPVHILMDPVHEGGPWTRGPCFVLSRFNCRGRMAETSALFLLFVWLLEGFVLTACKKKMFCEVSKLRELSD